MDTPYLKSRHDLNDPELVSIIDEIPLWSAAFGLRILDTVHYRRAIHALDIGSGTGFPLIELAMRLGSSSMVCGIDPWKAGIERARRKIRTCRLTNTAIIEGVAEAMPFPDSSFDLLVSNNGLNNVRDLPRTLFECNRVAKAGAQFVFTFNTEETFTEFYDIYRLALREAGLGELDREISRHIYSKRKPVREMRAHLEASGFSDTLITGDEFRYRFADGSAMLNHFFIGYAFMDAWKNILPEGHRESVFRRIEERLNVLSDNGRAFSMRVPFVTVDCRKRRDAG